jgi:uncharacterized protein
MKLIEPVIKLIRSKGVGIFFITQNPIDIPASVLSQLGLKVQHALRAFTAADNKAIKMASDNFPITEHYQIDKVLTTLGVGQAFVTALSEKGIPTPLIATMIASPETRMDIISDSELQQIVNNSHIANKYNEEVDRESAYDILTKRIETSQTNLEATKAAESKSEEKGGLGDTLFGTGSIGKSVVRTMSTTMTSSLTRQIVRGVLGAIFGKKK